MDAGRAPHRRQGRPRPGFARGLRASWAGRTSRSSAGRRRWRRPGSRRSRTWTWTTSIPSPSGSSACGASARCWSPWTATERACTPPWTAMRARAGRRALARLGGQVARLADGVGPEGCAASTVFPAIRVNSRVFRAGGGAPRPRNPIPYPRPPPRGARRTGQAPLRAAAAGATGGLESGLRRAAEKPGKAPAEHRLVVIALHLAVGYALVTGLARKVVEVIKAADRDQDHRGDQEAAARHAPAAAAQARSAAAAVHPAAGDQHPGPACRSAGADHHDRTTTKRPPPGPPPAAPSRPAPPQPSCARSTRPQLPRAADLPARGDPQGHRAGRVVARGHVAPNGSGAARCEISPAQSAARLRPRGDPRAVAVALQRPSRSASSARYEIDFKLTD